VEQLLVYFTHQNDRVAGALPLHDELTIPNRTKKYIIIRRTDSSREEKIQKQRRATYLEVEEGAHAFTSSHGVVAASHRARRPSSPVPAARNSSRDASAVACANRTLVSFSFTSHAPSGGSGFGIPKNKFH
jgi:hypothetical protein